MNTPLYKVRLTYSALSAIAVHGKSHFLIVSFVNANVERINNGLAKRLREEAMDWLEANQMSQHWLMTYDNTDHQRGIGQLTVTLSDRNAALMLKLALG